MHLPYKVALLLGLAPLSVLGLAAEPAQAQGYTLHTLVSFTGSNGASPNSSVIDVGGILYGTTFYGGIDGDGTVFSVSASGGPITDVVYFNGSNGQNPEFGLTYNPANGTLYGTTYRGGASIYGTVFALVPNAAVPESSPLILLALGLLPISLMLRTRKRHSTA